MVNIKFIKNGDILLLNRQPTLQAHMVKPSIQAHMVNIKFIK